MYKGLKWIRIVPDQPGKGGWKTGIHSFQLQPMNDIRTTESMHVYRRRWRKDFDSQAVPQASHNDVQANIVALALHPYTYPSLTDPSAVPNVTVLGHHVTAAANRYWDFTTGTLRDSHVGPSVPATFLDIAGRCFVGDGAREGMILDDRAPAIHTQTNQNLGIGRPTQPLQTFISGTFPNANIGSFGAVYAHNGGRYLNTPNANSPIGSILASSQVTPFILDPNNALFYAGALMAAAGPTVNAVTSNTTPFAAAGTISITSGTSLVTLSGAIWPATFQYPGLAVNFGGYSFVLLTHGPNGAAFDLDGNNIALTNVQGIILGVYNGPTLTNVPYTITGCSVLMPAASTLQTVNTNPAAPPPTVAFGYSQSTNSDLVLVGIKENLAGAVFQRNLGNVDLGLADNAGLTSATEGPTYAYAWYDPETGHMSNISPLFKVPKPISIGGAPNQFGEFANVTPFFQMDSGMISYPTGVDALRFSHIMFFRTVPPDGSTLYPIGSLQPYVGKVHPGSASTRGSWSSPLFQGWMGLPNGYVSAPPVAGVVPPNFWYDFSSDSDLLLSGGFRAPQFTNEKPMALLKGGLTEPGKVAYQAYWDRRLWTVSTQEPDVIAYSCDEAQCPLGVPEESFPPTNRLRIPAVDGQVMGMRTIGEMLLITTKRWAYVINGNNESNYRLMRVSARMNGVRTWLMDEFPSDVEGVPSTVYFLGSDKIVYEWVPGGACNPISAPIQDALNSQLAQTGAYEFGSRVHCISAWARRLVVVVANWLYFPFIFDVDARVWTKNAVDDGTSGFQPGCQGLATIWGADPPVNEIFSNPVSAGGAITVRSWIRDDGDSTLQVCFIQTFPLTFDGVKKRKQLCMVNAHVSDGVWQCAVTINEAQGPPFGGNVAMTPYPDPLDSIYGILPTPVDSGTAKDLVVMTAAFSAPNPSEPLIGYSFQVIVGGGAGKAEIYALDIGYIDVEEPGEVDA